MRHLSVRTVTQLFMHPNSAKNSAAQRDRELGPQISLSHKIPVGYTEGFCTQRCMEYIDLTNCEYLSRIFLSEEYLWYSL